MTNFRQTITLSIFLKSKFEDYNDEDVVEYNQWVSTDQTEMVMCSVDELIKKPVEKPNKLLPHSYIAKSQSSTFKSLKETTPSNVAVISIWTSVKIMLKKKPKVNLGPQIHAL